MSQKELNGLKEKDMQNPDRVERIEMVLEDLGKMGVISRFKNLKTLTLINQNLKEIEVTFVQKPHENFSLRVLMNCSFQSLFG